jgi:hypothetical protein
MSHKRKMILTSINGFLVVVGLYFGLPIVGRPVPADTRSAEQTQAIIKNVTDIEKLKAIVKADDDCIRADREIASLLRQTLIAASVVAVVVGLVNIMLVSFSGRKNDAAV